MSEDNKGLSQTFKNMPAGVVPRKIELSNPTGDAGVEERLVSRRLEDLNNKRIGLVDNSKEQSKMFMDILGEKLKERFKTIEIRRYLRSTSYDAEPKLLERILKECDAAIFGVAD